jgi:hypothetical protein
LASSWNPINQNQKKKLKKLKKTYVHQGQQEGGKPFALVLFVRSEVAHLHVLILAVDLQARKRHDLTPPPSD